jgi:hypothetical protein
MCLCIYIYIYTFFFLLLYSFSSLTLFVGGFDSTAASRGSHVAGGADLCYIPFMLCFVNLLLWEFLSFLFFSFLSYYRW